MKIIKPIVNKIIDGSEGKVLEVNKTQPYSPTTLAKIPKMKSGYQPKFPLRDFQKEAIKHIEAERSVLVSAPTGSGKTVIAVAAMYRA